MVQRFVDDVPAVDLPPIATDLVADALFDRCAELRWILDLLSHSGSPLPAS